MEQLRDAMIARAKQLTPSVETPGNADAVKTLTEAALQVDAQILQREYKELQRQQIEAAMQRRDSPDVNTGAGTVTKLGKKAKKK